MTCDFAGYAGRGGSFLAGSGEKPLCLGTAAPVAPTSSRAAPARLDSMAALAGVRLDRADSASGVPEESWPVQSGSYKLRHKIGQGAFADVFVADVILPPSSSLVARSGGVVAMVVGARRSLRR